MDLYRRYVLNSLTQAIAIKSVEITMHSLLAVLGFAVLVCNCAWLAQSFQARLPNTKFQTTLQCIRPGNIGMSLGDEVSRKIDGIKAAPGKAKKSVEDKLDRFAKSVDAFTSKTRRTVADVQAIPGKVESAYVDTKSTIERVSRAPKYVNIICENVGVMFVVCSIAIRDLLFVHCIGALGSPGLLLW